MNRFARTVLGYHGAKQGPRAEFLRRLLLGEAEVSEWKHSENEYDWLGHGIYFWEHSPERARRWAGEDGVVVGAVIQLGRCLDLTDLIHTSLLTDAYSLVAKEFSDANLPLPENTGTALKLRKRDCLVINRLVTSLTSDDADGPRIETVRGAFEEGAPAFPGACLRLETHIQIAVRDHRCIQGVFRPSRDTTGEAT